MICNRLQGALRNTLIRTRTPQLPVHFFSTTSSRRGLEEFFPPGVYSGENLAEEEPVVGRKYSIDELRTRSNSDLHKLWFVMLKERNLLLTTREECRFLNRAMPEPTRYQKIKKSMASILAVVEEREEAVHELNEHAWQFDPPSEEDPYPSLFEQLKKEHERKRFQRRHISEPVDVPETIVPIFAKATPQRKKDES